MDTISREQVDHQWPPSGADYPARQLSMRLGSLSAAAIPGGLLPVLAAAAAELAVQADIQWRVGTDDIGLSLIRLISRSALAQPAGCGEHVERALRELNALNVDEQAAPTL